MMTAKRPPSDTKKLTNNIPVTFGAFEFDRFRIPYMSAVMPIWQIDEYLSLVTDDTKYATQDWAIDELYQREVNQARVFDIVSQYLNPEVSKRPAFFNSLTVVVTTNNDGTRFKNPEPSEDYEKYLPIGPITISYDESEEGSNYPKSQTFGCIAWNRDGVHAVAIDGQHRMAALKEYYHGPNKENARKTSVSVLLLVIDKKAGYLAPKLDPLRHMRQLFIDLNKHAIPVSRARNLLLDDVDPTARFLRSLLSPSLGYDESRSKSPSGVPIGKEGEFLSCLPLNLVDWHGESKSKVDEGPYVTSVLALEWIVRTVLKGRYPKASNIPSSFNPDDEKPYENVKTILGTWPKSWNQQIKEQWETAKNNDTAFGLRIEDVDLLSSEFNSNWGRPIVRVLTTLGPYRELAQLRYEKRTINPQFGQWSQAYYTTKAQPKSSPKKIREHYEKKLAKIENELKKQEYPVGTYKQSISKIQNTIKNNNIFYYLVGQRALFHALVSLIDRQKIAEWSDYANIKLDPFKDCILDFYAWFMVEALNNIGEAFGNSKQHIFYRQSKVRRSYSSDDTKAISDHFWAGSLVKRDSPEQMDFSEIAAIRGGKWVSFLALLYWFLKVNPKYKRGSALMKAVDDPRTLKDLPFGQEFAKAILGLVEIKKGYKQPVQFLAGAIEGGDGDSSLIKALCKDRIAHVLKHFN